MRVTAVAVFLAVCVLFGARAEAVPVDINSTRFIRLEDFQDTFGDAFGKVDRSVVGYFRTLQNFQGSRLLELEGAERVREFDEFITEAQSAVDAVPIPAGSSSVAYTYDPKLETFVRWERPLTPALSQNAYTSGKGVLTIGTSYSRVNFTRFGEQKHDNSIFVIGSGIQVEGAGSIVEAQFLDFKLRENVFGVSLQYGILDNLDFGVFIPIVDLDFKARSTSMFLGKTLDGQFLTLGGRIVPSVTKLREADFDLPADLRTPGVSFDEQKTGVADIVLRTKMFFTTVGPFDTGALVNVSVPTGDDDDLLGTGSTRVDPRLLVSSSARRASMHVNVGPHFDTDDSDLDRIDYSVGGEIQLGDRVTLLCDQVGRVQYTGDRIRKFEMVPGVKVKIVGSLVVGFNAIVPLVHEGLTTDFIPNFAGDLSFVF